MKPCVVLLEKGGNVLGICVSDGVSGEVEIGRAGEVKDGEGVKVAADRS